jgi:16S rRNA processing protein RimM
MFVRQIHDMTTSPPRILLGHISSAQGIKGEVVVHAHTADPQDIGSYGQLSDAGGKRSFILKVLRVSNRGVVCRIDGVADRTQAEALRGTELYVDRSQLPEPEEEAFYHADLIGLAAVSAAGEAVGTVVAVHNFGAGDLIELRLAGSNDTEFLPFTKFCVPTIDIAGGKIVVVAPAESADGPPEA